MHTIEERFWDKVALCGRGGCWEWVGATTSAGYGHIWVQGRLEYSHRVSWMLFNHEDPGALCVLHHCDNPPCVNPSHLFLGTHQDNSDDCCFKGRNKVPCLKGEDHPSAQLTEEDVRICRMLYMDGWKQIELAALFGVSQPHISSIVTRKTWGHVQTRDCSAKGRHSNQNGGNNSSAKMTETKVRIARMFYKNGFSQRELAALFGVSQPTISDIVRKKLWNHVH